MPQRSIRASIVRGGTSKGVFVREENLPPPGVGRDEFILRLFGSPDPMQIDGMGGSHSTTSKLVAVSPSTRPDCDIEYLFAQVSVDRPVVDYGGNCGNLTSAVGPYAIDEGLVETTEPVTTVRLYNKNTAKRIDAHVPVEAGQAQDWGDFRIAGVPGTAARIDLDFLDPAGSTFDGVFPTGEPADEIETPDGEVQVSFVDVTNPLAFVRASDLGLRGDELPSEINGDVDLLARIERLRGACAHRLGLVDDPMRAADVTPGLPKLAFVAPPRSYTSTGGQQIDGERMDLLGRIMSMQKLHHAYAMTGIMCTAAAVLLTGTIPNEVADHHGGTVVRIGHPRGVAEAVVQLGLVDGLPSIEKVSVTRTARRLMSGRIFYPAISEAPAVSRSSGTG
jgi:2-methylaconitate cis-trans-isomerase PrpF